MVSLKSKESLLLSLLHSNPSTSNPIVAPTPVPVYLNVYDLLAEHRVANFFFHYCACRLLGAYHTSIQIYETEYYFGNGICKSRPHSHVGRLILSKHVGVTTLTQDEIETKILFDMYDRFTRKDYDLLRHNCNHFTNAFLYRLLGISLPMRFNRTERCLVATPCCTRTLNSMFGSDWTRPIPETSCPTKEKQSKCCSPERSNEWMNLSR